MKIHGGAFFLHIRYIYKKPRYIPISGKITGSFVTRDLIIKEFKILLFTIKI